MALPAAGRRGKVGTEVRQPFPRRAGHSPLRRAGPGVHRHDRVQIARGRRGSEPLPPGVPVAVRSQPLHPDLGDLVVAPRGEGGDAVARLRDFFEVGGVLPAGHVLPDPLADLEGGRHAQGHPRHHSDRAQADHGAAELVAIRGFGQHDHLAAAVHELEGDDLGRQVPGAAAVGGRGAGPHHRDVGQGSQVGDGEALAQQLGTELRVLDARPHVHRARGTVDRRHGVEPLEREHRPPRVRDRAEGVTSAERLDLLALANDALDLRHRRRSVEPGSAVRDVSGPVRPDLAGGSGLLGVRRRRPPSAGPEAAQVGGRGPEPLTARSGAASPEPHAGAILSSRPAGLILQTSQTSVLCPCRIAAYAGEGIALNRVGGGA